MALPEVLEEELEILRAIYGEDPVRLVQRKTEEENRPVCCIEVDLEPMTDEGVQLVSVTLLLSVPKGYPLEAVPLVSVEKSRGIGDVATEAMMDAAKKAVTQHGLQEDGCLAPLLSEVKDALGKAVSECSICMMDCDPGSAIFVACSCVFHRDCLEEWRGLKDKEKVAKADAATVSIKSQKDALDRLCAEAEEQAEEAEKQVAFHQLTVDRAATNVEQAMKKAQATADSDEEPSEAEEGEAEAEESDSSVELDSVDYRNEARWGAPEVSIGGMYHNKHTKKNWHPSVRMNRKRPKKYLKRIDEKLEELKKEGKRQLSEEMSQAVTKWEKALFEQKEAKLILDKEQENLKKLKEKSEKLAGELEWTANYLDEERQKFTSLPLLCPVCQNEVDVKEEKVQVVESEEKEPEVAPEEEEARKAAELRRAAAEEEERRQRAAAELAKVEEKMVRMLKGRPEDTDGDGDEPREENTEADLQGGYPTSPSQAVNAGGKAEPGETAEPEADAPRKEVDDELLTTIELLMEAYSDQTIEGQELLEPFNELLEVLRGSKEPTDREIQEVLREVIGIIEEESAS